MSSKTKIKKRWKPTIGAPLGPQEQKIMTRLGMKTPVPVSVLFRTATGVTHDDKRTMQQRIGAIVSRLNKKLKGRHVVAGDKPGTYRLSRVR